MFIFIFNILVKQVFEYLILIDNFTCYIIFNDDFIFSYIFKWFLHILSSVNVNHIVQIGVI